MAKTIARQGKTRKEKGNKMKQNRKEKENKKRKKKTPDPYRLSHFVAPLYVAPSTTPSNATT